MNRLYSLTLFCGLVVWGQNDLTTFQALFANQGAAPAVSPSVRNIGQAGHTAFILFTNKPAQTCVAGAADIGWERSYDGSTWSRFGDELVAIAADSDGQLATSINAYGAYPRVRMKIRSFDTVKCRVSIWYSGSVAGQANITLTAGAVTITNAPNVRELAQLAYSVDYDSGLVAVPSVAAAVTAVNTLVYSIYCNNKTAGPVTLSITNNAGTAEYVTSYSFPANSFGTLFELSKPMLMAGIKWSAGAATSLYCQVVGMQQ